MEKKKLLLPVTDWGKVPKRTTIIRDNVKYIYGGISSLGTIMARNGANWSYFKPSDTFLMEVEPVVMFEGVAENSKIHTIGQNRISSTEKAGYGFSFWDWEEKLTPGKKFKVTVQEVE